MPARPFAALRACPELVEGADGFEIVYKIHCLSAALTLAGFFEIINAQQTGFWLAMHIVLFANEKYYVHLRLQSDISDKYQSYKSKYA